MDFELLLPVVLNPVCDQRIAENKAKQYTWFGLGHVQRNFWSAFSNVKCWEQLFWSCMNIWALRSLLLGDVLIGSGMIVI